MAVGTTVGIASRNEVRDRLKLLLNEIAKIPEERITDSASVDDELQMDSVAFVELQVAIEEGYGIEVDPIEVVERNAFGAIVEYVHNLIVGAAANR